MKSHHLTADEVMVIAGGTPDGIGICHGVAESMGLQTLGIVASQGAEYRSDQCKKLIVVHNLNQAWTTKMPESGDEMLAVALRKAKLMGKGGELLVYNGGPQAYDETLFVAKDGHTVKLICDFKPLDNITEQPFLNEDKLFALREARVHFSQTQPA